MTLAADGLTGWSARPTSWLVVAVHAAFIVPASILLGLQLDQSLPWPPRWTGPLLALPLGLGLLVLMLPMSLAFAAGERPRGAFWCVSTAKTPGAPSASAAS